ncbi:AAA family ATPase [Streptomyces xinghaiensis]|uniref:AAA family ATPase n=1 Tax=Streptomyces xinghaiensis TaxID=1038928 RepID=UPI0034494E12
MANHRSVRAEQELSLVAMEFNEGAGADTGVRVDGRPVSVLPVVGLFGANASGKSNTLSALRFMCRAVRESFADWGKHPERVPREPFALDAEAREETSLFEVELLLDARGRRARYTYGFELSDERVEAEWLHAYPSGRRQVWFDREAGRPEETGGEFRFPGTGLKGRKERLAESTRPNALFLTVGAALNHPELAVVHRWFSDNLWLLTPAGDVSARTRWTRELLTGAAKENKTLWERIERMLSVADLGATGFTADPATGGPRILHRAAGGSERPLDFADQESSGTHAWLTFLGPLLHSMDRGGVMLVDELDPSLHPLLVAEVIGLFQDREANPHHAQLVFTTHNATLLGPSVVHGSLHLDQIWITHKNATGESELYPITAARKTCKDNNVERRYLHGHYGGVPRLTAGEIARETVRFGQT